MALTPKGDTVTNREKALEEAPEGWLTREQVENLAALLTDPAVQAICRMALYALEQGGKEGLNPCPLVLNNFSFKCGWCASETFKEIIIHRDGSGHVKCVCGKWLSGDEIATVAPSAWQPMETAPKDGTSVMLWDADRESVSIAFWLGAQERWVSPYDASPDTPTAWMPLPQPPSSDEASR